jgi:hypothetical protein
MAPTLEYDAVSGSSPIEATLQYDAVGQGGTSAHERGRGRGTVRGPNACDLRAREMTGIHNVAGNGEKTLAYDTAGPEKTLAYDAVGTEMTLACNGRGAGSGEDTLAYDGAIGDSVDKTLAYDAVGGGGGGRGADTVL